MGRAKGVGRISFVHLKVLPVDYVKIGGRYVRGVVVEHAPGHAFVRAAGAAGRRGR
jgi:EAL domain-containing protein (putative c-di-GMP-specific phosphodiesterase class I)